MRITDIELNINSILDVKKGRIPPSSPQCHGRHSDCFVFVLTGYAEYIFDGKKYIAEAGNVIYLAHNSNYSINVTDENYTFIFIDFLFEKKKNIVFSNDIYKEKNISLLKNNFETLYHLWKAGNFSEKIYCKSLIYSIYTDVARTFFSEYISHDRRKQVEFVVTYITENLHTCDLTVDKLSQMCNISAVHFRRIFSKIYHISPVQFIMLARISKAKELLITEAYSISTIAKKCGFENHYYFSKVFKSKTQLTPSQFRNFYRSNL